MPRSDHSSTTFPSLDSSLANNFLSCPSSSPYSPEPARHSGLTSSSSSSSSSAMLTSSMSVMCTSMAPACASPSSFEESTFATASTHDPSSARAIAAAASSPINNNSVASAYSTRNMAAASALWLPEELVHLTMSYLDRPELVMGGRVCRMWSEIHTSCDFWRPLYSLWFGDSIRITSSSSSSTSAASSSSDLTAWRACFRDRVVMLSQLNAHIQMLTHSDRSQRVVAVAFLRQYCELLKFVLPRETNPTPPAAVVASTVATEDAAAPSPFVWSEADAEPSIPTPPFLLHSSSLSSSSMELRHACHIIKDALVNRGWRLLFAQMSETNHPPAIDAIQQPNEMPLERDCTAFPFFAPLPERKVDDEIEEEYGPVIPSTPATPSSPGLSHSLRLIEYGAVLVAMTEHPFLSFPAISDGLDRIAELVRERIIEQTDADTTQNVSAFHSKLNALHHVLYTQLGFRGNQTRYYDLSNSFIQCVLRDRTGIPITMAVVYLAIGRRIGLHVNGVNSPGHFLLRVEDAANTISLPAPTAAASSPSVYFVDAFSGNMMTPAVTLNFLSLLPSSIPAGAASSSIESIPALQACSPDALFVRMYRNLMNLYQDPTFHRQRQQTRLVAQQQHITSGAAAAPTPPPSSSQSNEAQYEMEAYLHHCASQIIELKHIAGENTSDPLTSMFIERFRYARGMQMKESDGRN